jgi:cytochrome c-type biogenesis protein CcmH
LQADSVIARYYLALADEQAGDKAKAVTVYQTLVKAAEGHPQWQEIIKSRLAGLKGEPPPPAPDQQDMIRGMVSRLADRLAQKGGTAEEWKQLVRSYSVLGDSAKTAEAFASAQKAFAGDGAALAGLDALAKDIGLKIAKDPQP